MSVFFVENLKSLLSILLILHNGKLNFIVCILHFLKKNFNRFVKLDPVGHRFNPRGKK